MKLLITNLFSLWVLFLIFSIVPANAQIGCGDGRYVEPLFQVDRIENIEFAIAPAVIIPYVSEALTFNDNLFLDIYLPIGDQAVNRPCIIMNFGGAFEVGWKQYPALVDWCNAMAAKGYVVVSADYRLGFNILSNSSAVRAVYRGGQDMKAAIRWVRANASTYNIDTNLIFVGGHSAGAINAIHATYVSEQERADSPLMDPTYAGGLFGGTPDLGCLDCSGNSIVQSSTANAVINFWGAIGDINWIDSPGDAPIISFHGLDDNVVSPNTQDPFNLGIFPELSGSVVIDERCNTLGILHETYLYPGEGHELWTNAEIADSMVSKTARFLFKYFLRPATPAISGESTPCEGSTIVYSVPAHNGSSYCWSVSGGTVTAESANQVTILWDQPGTGTVQVSEIDMRQAETAMATKSIIINPLPIAMAGNDHAICVGETVEIEAVGNGSIVWMPATNLSNPSIIDPIAYPLATTTYSLQVNSSQGCTKTDEMVVSVDIDCVLIQAKLYLEGYYVPTTGLMRTNIRELSIMPLTQPYNTSPYNYTGSESVNSMGDIPMTMVDWILVEARSADNSNIVLDRRACWLRNDGLIWDIDNRAGVKFDDIDPGMNYYLVVYHRSHLGIMSALPLNYGYHELYDFTTNTTMAYGVGQLKPLAGTGLVAMYAGEYDGNGVINNLDYNRWIGNNAAVNQYYSWDGDGSGVINNLDYNLWYSNRSKVGISEIQQ